MTCKQLIQLCGNHPSPTLPICPAKASYFRRHAVCNPITRVRCNISPACLILAICKKKHSRSRLAQINLLILSFHISLSIQVSISFLFAYVSKQTRPPHCVTSNTGTESCILALRCFEINVSPAWGVTWSSRQNSRAESNREINTDRWLSPPQSTNLVTQDVQAWRNALEIAFWSKHMLHVLRDCCRNWVVHVQHFVHSLMSVFFLLESNLASVFCVQ